MPSLREKFLIDPNVIYLNHGSFGATPRPVFEAYQMWQRRIEQQPVHFIVEELFGYLKDAREILGEYLHADAEDLVFIPNATFGVNTLARSLDLKADDQVLASDQEYGACDNTWEFICSKKGSSYIRQPIRLPISSDEEFVEQFWQGVSSNTKVIYLSHITSSTAQRFPVELICKRARVAGILTIIDGAHSPGHIPVALEEIDADFYVGNCHKWMLGPKGSGFLYTRKDKQNMVEPLIVSWGWGENSPYTTGSKYLDNLEWWGTFDTSAYLSVPAAIQFMIDNNWDDVRKRCKELLRYALNQIVELTELQSMYAVGGDFYDQMGIASMPFIEDLDNFKSFLYNNYHIEIPLIKWGGHQLIRVSVQGYNTESDIEALLSALKEMLR